MRILYIHQYFHTRSGAGSIRSYEFARRWAAKGHSVVVITRADDQMRVAGGPKVVEHLVEGVRVLAINSAYSNYMGFTRRIWAFLQFMLQSLFVGVVRAGRVDVVFATSTPLTVGITGWLLGILKRAAFVFEIRDLWPEAPIQLGALRSKPAVWLARRLELFLYRVARHVVTLSPGMYADLAERGVPTAKLSNIPNCADLDIFSPRPASPELIAQYGLADSFRLVYAGAIGMANGLIHLVETARVLQERGVDDVQILIVGDGSQRPDLEQLCNAYQLRNLQFLPRMSKLEIAEFMPIADVCLSFFAKYPVLETNSPNKFFDGLALGKPVLINHGGWMQQVLVQYDAGVSVPSSDPEQLADAVVGFRDDPVRVERMGRNARRLAEDRYDRDKLSEELEQVLLSAAGREKRT